MKKLVLFLFMFFAGASILAQQFIEESFNESSLGINWQGDLLSFKVENGYLQSFNDLENDTFYISRALSLNGKMEWELEFRLNFSTSSKNYLDLYLIGDTEDLTQVKNGIFLRIGGTKDELALIEKRENKPDTILGRSEPDLTHNISGTIQLWNDNLGKCQIWLQKTGDNKKMMFELDGLDLLANGYTGISIRQSTSSFHNKHFVNYLYGGKKRVDSRGPIIDSTAIETPFVVDVFFNESIDTQLTRNQFIRQKNNVSASSVVVLNAQHLQVGFTALEPEQWETIEVKEIKDTLGNVSNDTVILVKYIAPPQYRIFDVLISEIMVDPSPQVGLPNVEYVELYNASGATFNLANCTFSDASKEITLPSINLADGEFAILVRSDELEFLPDNIQKIGVESLPSLNNSSDSLWIKSPEGEILDAVFYDEKWHTSSWKQEGGWSLERVNLNLPCWQGDNWASCEDESGGTPGLENSNRNNSLNDNQEPTIEKLIIDSDTTLLLYFTEWIIPYNPVIEDFSLFSGTDDLGFPDSVKQEKFNSLKLYFSDPFIQGQAYEIIVTGVSDCAGNQMLETEEYFGIPSPPDSLDILINEVMFDPQNGQPEWVEIYNASDKVIDISSLKIGKLDANRSIDYLETIQQESRYILAGDFLVISENKPAIIEKYGRAEPQKIIEADVLPSLPNDGSNLIITDLSGAIIDYMIYEEDLHSSWVDDTKGVSLERRSYKEESLSQYNWMSAARTVDYATPTQENSQSVKTIDDTNYLTINPDPFSPNGDGNNDVVDIMIFTEGNAQIQIKIFDKAGMEIIHLVNSALSADGSNHFSWDGRAKNGELVTNNTYIIFAEITTSSGDRKAFKKAVTLLN